MTEAPQFTDDSYAIDRLLFDPNNFRFQDEEGYVVADESRFSEPTVQDRAYRRLRAEGILELKNSILANGFLTVERLVVRPFGREDKFVVVEGNRRLAALRWIKEDHEAGLNVRDDVLKVLESIPVVTIDAGESSSAYLAIMGVRHVGGIKQWGGYQRAKLVTDLRDEHSLEVADIANRLGMTRNEVNRRYRAFKALQQMQEDEEFMDEATSNMYPIFHEALALPAVRSWLNWNDEETRFEDTEQLRLFYSLITETASEEEGGEAKPPKLPTYIQVRELRGILSNPEAKQILLDPDRSFSDALGVAKAEEFAKTWKSQVAEALAVLNSISAFELSKMNDADVAIVSRLQDSASQVLSMHKKLVSE